MKLAVVGAGNMGSGIAQKMATEGFDVVLVDLDAQGVQRGMDRIAAVLEEGVARRLFTATQAQTIQGRVHGTHEWRELAEVDLVVEAVFEDVDVKRRVYSELENACRADTIIATNTSSFSVTDLASGMEHPQRFIGLHYFFHPAKNRLVEVIPGAMSDPLLVEKAWRLQEQLGKTPIRCADASGFVVNRFFVSWLNEAVRLLEEGVGNVPTIDAAAKAAFGVGMGPFELMNVTGVPIAMHATRTLEARFGAMHAPLPALVEHGTENREWDLGGAVDEAAFDAINEHLLGTVFQVACRLVDEGVGSVEDTDIGARVGLRWPRGPFELINALGIERAAALVEAVCARWSLDFPTVLAERRDAGAPFVFALVTTDIDNTGIATLTINRPDAMNALNPAVVEQLEAAFTAASTDPAVNGIVIAGAGKAFVAGADIKYFVDNIEADSIARIESFTADGQALFDAIDRCEKPVVARMNGLTLGGGLELALACDRIVAADRATMGFPETGIGIYPGLGGTQRTSRRIGVGMTKYLIGTGQVLTAEQALQLGLVDAVAPLEILDAAVRDALALGTGAERSVTTTPAQYRAVANCFEQSSYEDLLLRDPAKEGDALLAKALQKMPARAPVAIRIAFDIIESGAALPLPQGLELELAHLNTIFGTRDAYNGLRSVGGKPPVYEGA